MKNETEALKASILALQHQRANELFLLRAQFQTTYESLKPINLIKNTYKEVASTLEFKNNVVRNVIGIGTGLLTRKLLMGGSHHPIKNFFGTLIQMGITNLVSRHSEDITNLGGNLLQRFSKNRNTSQKQYLKNTN